MMMGMTRMIGPVLLAGFALGVSQAVWPVWDPGPRSASGDPPELMRVQDRGSPATTFRGRPEFPPADYLLDPSDTRQGSGARLSREGLRGPAPERPFAPPARHDPPASSRALPPSQGGSMGMRPGATTRGEEMRGEPQWPSMPGADSRSGEHQWPTAPSGRYLTHPEFHADDRARAREQPPLGDPRQADPRSRYAVPPEFAPTWERPRHQGPDTGNVGQPGRGFERPR
jgi:hypothetical protein